MPPCAACNLKSTLATHGTPGHGVSLGCPASVSIQLPKACGEAGGGPAAHMSEKLADLPCNVFSGSFTSSCRDDWYIPCEAATDADSAAAAVQQATVQREAPAQDSAPGCLLLELVPITRCKLTGEASAFLRLSNLLVEAMSVCLGPQSTIGGGLSRAGHPWVMHRW